MLRNNSLKDWLLQFYIEELFQQKTIFLAPKIYFEIKMVLRFKTN